MATTISGLQGRPIYRDSSYAPTRGTNNPTGYLQRELSKQGLVNNGSSNNSTTNPSGNVGLHGGVSTIGNDGASDTRSGLAANSLKTTGSVGTSQGQGNVLAGGTPQLTIPDAPTAQISAIGEIKLPYNFNSTQNILSEQQAAQKALLEIQQGRQADAMKYVKDIAGTQDTFDETMSGSKNNAGARGTGFSSAYGSAVSKNYNQFSKLMQELANDRGARHQASVQQEEHVLGSLNANIRQELANMGYEAMENAGEWVIKKKDAPKAPSVVKKIAASAPKKQAPKNKAKPKNKGPKPIQGIKAGIKKKGGQRRTTDPVGRAVKL